MKLTGAKLERVLKETQQIIDGFPHVQANPITPRAQETHADSINQGINALTGRVPSPDANRSMSTDPKRPQTPRASAQNQPNRNL